ncbi:hypothetical protein CWO85_01005 [Candidatus Phytoplasma ziziphi]|uniref:Integrase catalytic domain-containing protein n=1 Tax=Ziziphus jujuba witches'-broom phytoplasma TaxID=135727 RepID=A0A660HM63_ZIZJU|nr:IS3 family transposase [Candidatus Phytoplasma ziziphi]AYJ01115.1 hypothetical protein CWO85_01005 [Candidatus Phytoplasma ziziphi]
MNNRYKYKTKLKAIKMSKKEIPTAQILKVLKIKSRHSIYQWVKWFNQGEYTRLQRKPGGSYKKTFSPLSYENFYHLKCLSLLKDKQPFIKHIQTLTFEYPLYHLLKLINLSFSTYYGYFKRQTKQQEKTNKLKKMIKEIVNQGTYQPQQPKNKPRNRRWGYRIIHQTLLTQNMKVNPKTVYKYVKVLNLLSQRLKMKKKTWQKPQEQKTNNYHNLLQNQYKSDKPNQKLCTDITYLNYGKNQKLYLSAVLDLYNRQIVAYHIKEHQTLNLIIDTAKQLQKGHQGSFIHSDRGMVYCSPKYQQILNDKRI